MYINDRPSRNSPKGVEKGNNKEVQCYQDLLEWEGGGATEI